jgi:hypothetical protein
MSLVGDGTMNRATKVGGALALLFALSPAAAQQPQMVRVRASIESVDHQTLTVKARDGTAMSMKLPENVAVRGLERKSIADVKQGSFVGITAMPLPDGTQKVVEVHIFPESMRGTGEGHRPWDLLPNSTMTNGNIDAAVAGADGQELVLKYKDGEKKFIMPPNIEVVMFVPGTVADLKPGEKVFMVAKKLPDGTLEPQFITVGHNGVNPPM